MTDFKVNTDALRSASDGIDAVADGVDGLKGGISQPSPVMCGILVSGIVGNVLAQATYVAAQGLISGIAQSDRVMGSMLRETAEIYDQFEDDVARACHEFTQEI